ncbi:MAG: PilZ domain-containing protein [Desulfomonilia bacterium]|jgi:ribosomal protein L37AE/L43A|uniref:PilZ domain protein n=1 Tax=anaerobic digester metagenome TaxID=1263854 RepID=A0A485LVL7_9ZZZZ|nr:PilZ domain-containing protein [Pseudomonadota bacterium]HON39357.1 PilZ domain-containing protein [Deltaproteobacteria bacterium]HRS57173.1 PilZ domain-containing protein [Desulfomonilia bacterium]HPD22373.1 PilZ domain-containing protein [Deltaproteobacteria bacterium]HPX18723.1 PilZ domain-containing protein [Deltaproteobacteria bacterium]
MAFGQENRTHQRLNCRIPMEYTLRRSRKPYQATVYNISDGGLYVETDRELRPGQDIRISIHQDMPEGFNHLALDDQSGIIRWSLPATTGRRRVYRAGIRLSSADVRRAFQGLPEVQYFCDVCGEQVSYRQVRKAELIWMCPHCSEYVKRLPGDICRMAYRHLIGNVI